MIVKYECMSADIIIPEYEGFLLTATHTMFYGMHDVLVLEATHNRLIAIIMLCDRAFSFDVLSYRDRLVESLPEILGNWS